MPLVARGHEPAGGEGMRRAWRIGVAMRLCRTARAASSAKWVAITTTVLSVA